MGSWISSLTMLSIFYLMFYSLSFSLFLDTIVLQFQIGSVPCWPKTIPRKENRGTSMWRWTRPPSHKMPDLTDEIPKGIKKQVCSTRTVSCGLFCFKRLLYWSKNCHFCQWTYKYYFCKKIASGPFSNFNKSSSPVFVTFLELGLISSKILPLRMLRHIRPVYQCCKSVEHAGWRLLSNRGQFSFLISFY